MGHFVTGIISEPQALQAFAERHSLHGPVALTQGLALLPLRDEDIDAFIPAPQSGFPSRFTYLSAQLAELIAAASITADVVYFETEYHGGTGGQGAAVYRQGKCIYGPTFSEAGPINEALATIGVRVSAPARDAFEAIGLNRHRSSDDWLGIEDED